MPVLWAANAAITVTLSGGGLTWVSDKAQTGSITGAFHGITVFSAPAPDGLASSTTLTATFSASNSWGCTILACYAEGLATSSVVDGTPPGQFRDGPGTTSWSSTSQTTTNNDDLLIGAALGDGGAPLTSTATGSATELIEARDATNEWTSTLTYRIVAATGTYDATGTWSSIPVYADIACMVAYKAAVDTLAYDAETRWPVTSTTDTTTGDRTFTHVGSTTAKGAVVFVQGTGTVAFVTGVLYGGVAMTLEQTATDTTEAGRVDLYVLASGVPTGSQTVTLQGATATAKWATCATVKAPTAVKVNTSAAVNTTVGTAAQVSLTTTATACSFAGVHHGAAAPSATPVAGNTLLFNMDYGTLSANSVRRTAVDAAGTLALGVTIASDDFCAAGVAFSYASSSSLVSPRRPMRGLIPFGRCRV